ncbi:MAG: PDR/VanB family oxidoreductase [Methylocystis sp.]
MSDEASRSVIVAKKNLEAHNMMSFELVDAHGGELPPFSAGSHIDVTIPGNIVRQYSICNSPKERNRYVIGVWKDGNSRGGSVALHDAVNVGDRLEISLPRNRFRVPKNATRAILLARGIGVTPILSIADDLKTRGVPFELHYVYALMAPNAFSGFIGASSFAENTTYYLESSKDNQLLNPATLVADRPDDTQLFICGADWWMDPIVSLAKQKGWSDERIHIERFTAKLAAPVLDKVFEVKIASTGAVYKIPGDKTVTAFLEENGVKIPTSCEQGVCGTCKIKVLEGEIDHRDKRLTPEQKAEGYFLACVSRGKSDLLVLDL